MIECYYKWCKYHSVDEPYCERATCTATDDQMKYWAVLRTRELKSNDPQNRMLEAESLNLV